jgi:glutamine amidotransferase
MIADQNIAENWVNVPTNSILTIHNQTVMVHPIMDQYYDRDPHHRRSTAFVRNKGLSANEKGAARSDTPFNIPSSVPSVTSLPHLSDHPESHKQRFRGPTIPSIPSGISRSRTPDASSSNSTLPRSRTPLSHAETLVPEPSSLQAPLMDVRALTAPPVIRTAAQQPAQGNIKKKRASLSAVDASHGGVGLVQYLDTSPITPEPVRTEFGNPNKIARLFPELALQ